MLEWIVEAETLEELENGFYTIGNNGEPVKHGRWLPSDKGDGIYTCSECGFVRDAYVLEEKAFCPHCGAKMDEPEAEP